MRKISLKNLSGEIKNLVQERSLLRKSDQFGKADQIRKILAEKGYEIVDNKNQSEVFIKAKAQENKSKSSFLVLFGSGEIAPEGRKVHEYVFEKLNKNEIKIALITSPAGFQPNVKIVYEEIAQFFSDHLKNYHPRIKIVYANTPAGANNPQIVEEINDADYLFTGPGSPTYGLKVLKNSLMIKRIIQKVKNKTSLCLASAATLTFSHFTQPVYEIYKVGVQNLYWEEGLNFFENFYERITVIPHFDNREGGKKTDTSRCFIGKERFTKMTKLLPAEEKIWGIEEKTGVVINLQSKELKTLGKGKLHTFTPSESNLFR